MSTMNELCLHSDLTAGFDSKRMSRIEKHLAEDHRTDLPWYLRVIVAIGAWLASGFFLGCAIELIGWQPEHETTIGIIGFVILIIAVAIGRQAWGLFIAQCALAVSLAGQAMLYYGFAGTHHSPVTRAALMSIGLAVILYELYPNFLSRLMTCFAALQICLFWFYEGDGSGQFTASRAHMSSDLLVLYWTVHLAAICFCFLRPKFSVPLAPLGYALITSLAAWQIEKTANTWTYSRVVTETPPWMAQFYLFAPIVFTALGLFGVAVWSAGGLQNPAERTKIFIALGVALAILVWLGSGGIPLSLFFVLLGFSLQNRPILALGLFLLPCFLVHYYYYNLDLDLLTKSGVLIGSGLVLFALRAGLIHGVFANLKEKTI